MIPVIAAPDVQDPRDGGFVHTMPGELLALPVPCDNPECGCDRTWTGLGTGQGSTLAVVAEHDIRRAIYIELIAGHLIRRGWDALDATSEGEWFAQLAERFPLGALLTAAREGDEQTVSELEIG